MLLLFALFSHQEQPPDVKQTNKKLLLGTWLFKEIGIWYTPDFLKIGNVGSPFENLT